MVLMATIDDCEEKTSILQTLSETQQLPGGKAASAFAVTEATNNWFVFISAMAMLINGKQNALKTKQNVETTAWLWMQHRELIAGVELAQLVSEEAKNDFGAKRDPHYKSFIANGSQKNWGGPMTSFVNRMSGCSEDVSLDFSVFFFVRIFENIRHIRHLVLEFFPFSE